jgi:hypothetical protein
MPSEHANRGGHANETTNLLRADDPWLAPVYPKMIAPRITRKCHAGAALAIVL